MGVTSLVADLEGMWGESQNQRDKRVEDLWKSLDTQSSGYLDLKGLKKGLKKIDHPMKNADEMLRQIMNRVDTNSDGKIDYEEFRTFVEQTEYQLLHLFNTIDRDSNGKLDKSELREAFKQAGMTVPIRKLDDFFSDIDLNNDGYISFNEWRDFLLFMPVHYGHAPLEAVLSYYSHIVTLTAEGDSMVSEETLQGSGTTGFFLDTLFGSLLRIDFTPVVYNPTSSSELSSPSSSSSSLSASASAPGAESSQEPLSQNNSIAEKELRAAKQLRDLTPGTPDPAQSADMYYNDILQLQTLREELEKREALGEARAAAANPTTASTSSSSSSSPAAASASSTQATPDSGSKGPPKKTRLTHYLPDSGYFIAGAASGGLSRTATAPLDRLKVYLLVNTKANTNTAATALKQGRPLVALYNAGKPISEAFKELWRAGGIRSLFAGNGLNVLKIMPESAIKFGSYEAAKRALAKVEGHNDPKHINSVSRFVAGGLAGMVAQFCVYPLDTLKFRLQTSTVQGGLTGNALIFDTAKKMWKTGGVRTAYRGVTMGLMGMFPYSAIDMGTFELLKSSYTKYLAKYQGIHEEDAKAGNFVTGIIGATSGAFGASVVYPLNVLRTRLQTQGTVMHPATYTGIWDVAHKTLKNEGVRGMYKGLAPNLLKVAPALSITWVVYENAKHILKLE